MHFKIARILSKLLNFRNDLVKRSTRDAETAMTDTRDALRRGEENEEARSSGPGAGPRRRRRIPRIDQEIDLYCNPFVEVHLRLSRYLQRLAQSALLRLTDMALVVQDNTLLRHIFFVSNYTMS